MLDRQEMMMNDRPYLVQRETSLFWSCTLLLLISFLLFESLLDASGKTTPDSYYYLGFAEYIRTGFADADFTYRSIWPPGYSALISFTSLILHTDVWLSSKVVNIFALLGTLYVFHYFFKT